jgi:hypothetical protein
MPNYWPDDHPDMDHERRFDDNALGETVAEIFGWVVALLVTVIIVFFCGAVLLTLWVVLRALWGVVT